MFIQLRMLENVLYKYIALEQDFRGGFTTSDLGLSGTRKKLRGYFHFSV